LGFSTPPEAGRPRVALDVEHRVHAAAEVHHAGPEGGRARDRGDLVERLDLLDVLHLDAVALVPDHEHDHAERLTGERVVLGRTSERGRALLEHGSDVVDHQLLDGNEVLGFRHGGGGFLRWNRRAAGRRTLTR